MNGRLALSALVVIASLVGLCVAVRGPADRRPEDVAGGMSMFLLGMVSLTTFLIPPSAIATITQVVFLVPALWFLAQSAVFAWRRTRGSGR